MTLPSHRGFRPIGTIGRYEILGRLAVGGMAEIFLGRETGPRSAERDVVVKRILPNASVSEMHIESFVHEAKLVMHLRHPAICSIYEFGEEDESFYLAMEYVHGVSLRDLADAAALEGGLPVPIATKIVAEVAGALHHAHTAVDAEGEALGIVHRDVTPENIMISFDGRVKLLDFGIAKAKTQTTQTQQGELKGKFAYMSPEQYQGVALDGRSDIFSLGVCLHEALLGGRLFHRDTEFETVAAVLFGEAPPSVRETRPEVPEELDLIVQRAIQRDVQDRYSSAGEMEAALLRNLVSRGEVVREAEVAGLMQRLFPSLVEEGPVLDRSPIRRTLREDTIERTLAAVDRFDIEGELDSVEIELGREQRVKRWGIVFLGFLVVVGALAVLAQLLTSTAPQSGLAPPETIRSDRPR